MKTGKERWRTISGYDPAYQVKVSDRGRVIIVPETKYDADGREFAVLAGRDIPIDLLVAQAFIPNYTNSEVPIHKNGIMGDSRSVNLKWLEHGKDADAPGRMCSTLNMLQYILNPSLLAERDKEFTKFYTYLDYLWKSGQLPLENERAIMEAYDAHRKRTNEEWISKVLSDEKLRKELGSMLQDAETPLTDLDSLAEVSREALGGQPAPDDTLTEEVVDRLAEEAGLVTPRSIPNPLHLIPDEILAQAMLDLYDRAWTASENEPDSVARVNVYTLMPKLVGGAIRRVINQGDNIKAYNWLYDINESMVGYTSKDSDNVYMSRQDPKIHLAASLTNPYHLNMLPHLPSLSERSVAQRTSHIQSVLNMMKKERSMPSWAFDAVLESLGKEVWEKLGFIDAFGDPVDERPDGYDFKEKVKELLRESGRRSTDNGENETAKESVTRKEPDMVVRDEDAGLAENPVNPVNPVDSSESANAKKLRTVTERVYDENGYEMMGDRHGTIRTDIFNPATKKKPPYPNDDFWDVEPEVTHSERRLSAEEKPEIKPDSPAEDETATVAEKPVYAGTEPEVPAIGKTLSFGFGNGKSAGSSTGAGKTSASGKPATPTPLKRRDELGNEVHPDRRRIFTADEIKTLRLVKHINTLPEYDEQGRPLYDDRFLPLVYDDTLEVPVAPAKYANGVGDIRFLLRRNARRYRQSRELIKWLNDRKSLKESGKLSDGSDISPLYDPKRDITKGMINTATDIESSSYYDEAGRKVYHNVRYGERYDPERHSLFIPEMYEFPEMFNLRLQKELYLSDYADFLRRHNPEMEDPDVLRQYYETAKAAKRLMDAVPNSDMNRIFRRGGSVSVRGWLPDGECVVFPSITAASEATGCTPDAIRECVRGDKVQAYGIRWELVDISDMDTLVNRYIGRIMEVCEKGEIDVDWDEYLTDEAKRRLIEKSPTRGGFSPSKDDIRRILGIVSEGEPEYEPDSEVERDFRFVDPFAEDLYDAEYGELPSGLAVEADMDDLEERLKMEISELEDERDNLVARRSSPLGELLDDMLGD